MMTLVLQQNAAILKQLQSVLASLSDAQYTAALAAYDGHSIGDHVRHLLDFYVAVIRRKATTVVDYDARVRDPLIAQSRTHAAALAQSLAEALPSLSQDQPLRATSNGCSDLPTSLARELSYAHDHAVHHLALIKVAMRVYAPEIPLDAELGVAPSTAAYSSAQVS